MNQIKFQLPTLLPNRTRAAAQPDERTQTPLSESKSIALDFFKRMQQFKTEAVSSRKNAAKARMAELKARIENMMKFAHIGKGNPRLVAELAKELKALVAQYGGTAGGAGQMATPQVGQEAVPADSGQTATEAGPADSKATLDQAAQVAAQASAAEHGDKGANPATAGKTGEMGNETKAAHSPWSLGKGDADDKAFFSEAKKLAQLLKQLLALENRKLSTEADQRDLKAAKKAIADVETEMKQAQEAAGQEQAELAADAGASYDASGAISASAGVGLSVFA